MHEQRAQRAGWERGYRANLTERFEGYRWLPMGQDIVTLVTCDVACTAGTDGSDALPANMHHKRHAWDSLRTHARCTFPYFLGLLLILEDSHWGFWQEMEKGYNFEI